jgi:hypothetical protein
MGATSGAGTAYPNEAHEFTPGFVRVMLLSLLSCVAFCSPGHGDVCKTVEVVTSTKPLLFCMNCCPMSLK